MQLDLVLINPGGRKRIYQALATELAAIEPPVWAGLIATYIRKQGFSVEIVDADAGSLEPDEIALAVRDRNPRLVAIVVYGHQPSASTQNMGAASAACTAVRNLEPERKILMLGGHVAALPKRTLAEEVCDFVCDGEGPVTVRDLLVALREPSPDLSNVRGLWYRHGGLPRFGKPAPNVVDLDGEMPGLAWDLLPISSYRAHNWHCFGNRPRQPYAAIYTTLGCPYHCTFCCIQAPFKSGESALGLKAGANSYRRWSPEATVRQIDELVTKYGVKNIKIADEMFVLHPKHVSQICDMLIERDYGLNIWAYARVDTVKDDLVEKLRRAGFTWIALGIEAANEQVRDEVQKGFDQNDVVRTIEKLRAADINIIGNYIFGLPEDDAKTMEQTLDMALELNCEFANFYTAMAYPGSPLYETALEKGWPLPATWGGFSQHAVDTLPVPTKHISASEVLRFRDEAFQKYFLHPKYLSMVERRFGTETAQDVRRMASHRLERQFA